MSSLHTLRGSCHCGRNQYVVQIPGASSESAQVLFDSNHTHRIASASPLSAFLRVPLSWYHSRTFSFFPNETRSVIRRIYTHPDEQHAMRHFCGFCGTPLSYWSEEPRSEADYIQLTLGSLLTEDLHGLEEMGLIPSEVQEDGDPDEDRMDIVSEADIGYSPESALINRDFTGIPWFNTLLSGSLLGSVQKSRGVRQSRSGIIRVEWEVTGWVEGDNEETESLDPSLAGKRKRGEADEVAAQKPKSPRREV